MINGITVKIVQPYSPDSIDKYPTMKARIIGIIIAKIRNSTF